MMIYYRNDKLEGLLGETQDKLSVYVAKDDGKQIKSRVNLKNIYLKKKLKIV